MILPLFLDEDPYLFLCQFDYLVYEGQIANTTNLVDDMNNTNNYNNSNNNTKSNTYGPFGSSSFP